MDIANATDLKELKALAYDQMLLQMQVENNLKLINQRIEQLVAQLESEPAKAQKK